jgi:hypothetical protein
MACTTELEAAARHRMQRRFVMMRKQVEAQPGLPDSAPAKVRQVDADVLLA